MAVGQAADHLWEVGHAGGLEARLKRVEDALTRKLGVDVRAEP